MPKIIGLTSEEAKLRLEKNGRNIIEKKTKINPLKILISQFSSPLIIILILASIISVLIGYLPEQTPNFLDAILIFTIVLISGLSGFFQEYKAEKSIKALQKMAMPIVQVIRDGSVIEIHSSEIVIGDIVLLEAGNIVPADAKLLESFNLKIDESILTGESESIEKKIGDEIYMNTSVYVGSAKIKILKTGMQTRIGKIADKLQKISENKTSFEIEIQKLSKKLFFTVGIISIIVFIFGLLKYDLYTSLLTSISLAVGAVPEGLPAIVVLALTLGSKKMYKKNALVKKLDAVESVGAINIICTDKTGTLTKNEMSVSQLYLNNKAYNTDGIKKDEKKLIDEIYHLIKCGILCNNTKIIGHPEGKRQYLGDQTEVSLLKIGEKFNLFKEDIEKKYARVNEIPFNSERKMMSVIVRQEKNKKKTYLYSKGATEILLNKCKFILENNKIRKITNADKKTIIAQNENFASSALRILGFAYKEINNNKYDENNLIWLGLQAMADPPHQEVANVLTECKTAGIRVIMITGDNAITAKAIANKIGLKSTDVIEGNTLNKLSTKELKNKLQKGINIFARTTPIHKMAILKILQKKYQVAMTGDGVNDSLALKQANVGIAMGKNGTAVSKESSDIILLDDNFTTIVVAIKEGRRIFSNIRKFINYLLVSNLAEILVLLFATVFLTLEKPILLPVQILWINLLTDGLPALALGADPAKKDIMKDQPRKKGEPIINKRLAWLIGIIGAKKSLILMATFFIILPKGEDIARTTLLTGFIIYEFVRIASIRYQEKLNWFSNFWLLGALGVSLLFQIIIIYTPLNNFFHIVKIGLYEWGILSCGAIIGFILTILITKIIIKKIPE